MRIKKGDTVQIMKGRERGKTGKVMKVNPKHDTITLEGLNLYKKHQKPKKQGEKGQVVEVPRPLQASSVMPYCARCKKGVRVGMHRTDTSSEMRCKKCEGKI